MRSRKILTSLIFSILWALVISINTNVYGYFSYNRSCEVFPNQCDTGGEKSAVKGPVLSQLIIDGAGYFLQSNSDYQSFLKKVELSPTYGTNYVEIQNIIDKTIENLELARSIYYEIWQLSMEMEYDPSVLEKLYQFDYPGYQEKNDLFEVIFQKVSTFLKSGDVRGTYKKFYDDAGIILKGLKGIRESVDSNTIPKVSDCWRINQKYFSLELFGQYVAEVFYALE